MKPSLLSIPSTLTSGRIFFEYLINTNFVPIKTIFILHIDYLILLHFYTQPNTHNINHVGVQPNGRTITYFYFFTLENVYKNIHSILQGIHLNKNQNIYKFDQFLVTEVKITRKNLVNRMKPINCFIVLLF